MDNLPVDRYKFEHGKNYSIKVSDLHPNPIQPRKYFQEIGMEGLKQSIASCGLIQPISFTLTAGQLVIIAGERRWRATREIGSEYIQAIYVDRNLAEIALAENFQREDLNAMEKAEAVMNLKMHGASHVHIATLTGKSVSSLSELLSLNRLPESIKSECRMSTKYVLTRLIQIAKAPDQRAMLRQFMAYQRELENGRQIGAPKRRMNVLDQLEVSIKGLHTQIDNAASAITNNRDQCRFLSMLYGMEQRNNSTARNSKTFSTSVSRRNEEKP